MAPPAEFRVDLDKRIRALQQSPREALAEIPLVLDLPYVLDPWWTAGTGDSATGTLHTAFAPEQAYWGHQHPLVLEVHGTLTLSVLPGQTARVPASLTFRDGFTQLEAIFDDDQLTQRLGLSGITLSVQRPGERAPLFFSAGLDGERWGVALGQVREDRRCNVLTSLTPKLTDACENAPSATTIAKRTARRVPLDEKLGGTSARMLIAQLDARSTFRTAASTSASELRVHVTASADHACALSGFDYDATAQGDVAYDGPPRARSALSVPVRVELQSEDPALRGVLLGHVAASMSADEPYAGRPTLWASARATQEALALLPPEERTGKHANTLRIVVEHPVAERGARLSLQTFGRYPAAPPYVDDGPHDEALAWASCYGYPSHGIELTLQPRR